MKQSVWPGFVTGSTGTTVFRRRKSGSGKPPPSAQGSTLTMALAIPSRSTGAILACTGPAPIFPCTLQPRESSRISGSCQIPWFSLAMLCQACPQKPPSQPRTKDRLGPCASCHFSATPRGLTSPPNPGSCFHPAPSRLPKGHSRV